MYPFLFVLSPLVGVERLLIFLKKVLVLPRWSVLASLIVECTRRSRWWEVKFIVMWA
jgi:hypothetical protein